MHFLLLLLKATLSAQLQEFFSLEKNYFYDLFEPRNTTLVGLLIKFIFI